ncbi:hypothetical protein Tco_1312132 [Tanacetum coccineum]
MAAHTERVERFENAIFKQREEINDRMAKMNDNDDMAADGGINGTNTEMLVKEAEKETEAKNGTKNKPIKRAQKEETAEASSSQPVGYYLKHRINEKLIEGLVDNHRGPVYEAILRKKIRRKEDIGGNFEIPCSIGGLKCMNTLVDQGSDVNVIPLSTYMKLTDERLEKTKLSHSWRISLHNQDHFFRYSREGYVIGGAGGGELKSMKISKDKIQG